MQRYSRHLIMPEVGVDGQRRAEGGQRAAASAPAGSARRRRCISPRPASAVSASSTSTSSTSATCSARCCMARPTSAGRSSTRRAIACRAQPRSQRRDATRRALTSANALESVRATTTSIRRRHRQLSDALPGQRRLRAARQAERLRQHLPLRRPGLGLRDEGRPVLPLPVSRAAAARPGAELRRRRRARRAARASSAPSRPPKRSS